MSIVKSLFLFLVLILSSNQALSLSCGSSLRTADLSPATNCITGPGNPSISAINALFDTPPSWQRVSSVEDNTSGGSDGWFGVSLDPNSNWGQSNVSGE